jgi:DUF1365 family protein
MGGAVGGESWAYRGAVVHKRSRPRRHALRYSVFSVLFDLDALEDLDRSLKLFSLDRFNLFALRRADFGPRDGSDLAAFARRRAKARGISEPVARVRLLAYPRIFGYAFNPLAVWFLEAADGRCLMLIYEVRNTFGEYHFYEEPYPQKASDGTLRHGANKAFYVSPFNDLSGRYRFAVRPPGEAVFTGVTLSDPEGGLVTAYFSGEREALSDATLAKLALEYPFMTAKIIVAIHWEALKLWLKGVPLTLKLRKQREGRRPAPR